MGRSFHACTSNTLNANISTSKSLMSKTLLRHIDGGDHMRARLLVLGSAFGSLGWGAVLPYQFAYAADTRGWGVLVAAAASSLFSIGALVAAPLAGRLADRFDPVAVVVAAQLVGATAVGLLVFVGESVPFLVGMLVFGLGLAAAVPGKQVLALRWSSGDDRRKIFAYKFTGESLGM